MNRLCKRNYSRLIRNIRSNLIGKMRDKQNDENYQGLPDNVVGVNLSGTITGEDYDTVLIPAIKDKLKKYKKIRMLFQGSRDFSHLTLDAYLEDAKVTWHMFEFEKVAVVSDIHWMNDSVKLFRFLMPMPVNIFSNDELDKARAWVNE